MQFLFSIFCVEQKALHHQIPQLFLNKMKYGLSMFVSKLRTPFALEIKTTRDFAMVADIVLYMGAHITNKKQ